MRYIACVRTATVGPFQICPRLALEFPGSINLSNDKKNILEVGTLWGHKSYIGSFSIFFVLVLQSSSSS